MHKTNCNHLPTCNRTIAALCVLSLVLRISARAEDAMSRLTSDHLLSIISLPGKQIADTGLFAGNWHEASTTSVTNWPEFAPFQRALILWDKDTGILKSILLQCSARGRPSHELDPYFTSEEILAKRFGPSDSIDLSVSLMAKSESAWHLGRRSIFPKRIPERDGENETVEYELGVVGKEADIPLKPINSVFGYSLGAAMSQDLAGAGQPQPAGGVLVGVRPFQPHPLLNSYALGLTQKSAKIYSIHGMFSGAGGRAAEIFTTVLKEARASYDWDECEWVKSYSLESVRLEKGDRSIVVEFKVAGVGGPATASIRFIDGAVMDEAVLESKGF